MWRMCALTPTGHHCITAVTSSLHQMSPVRCVCVCVCVYLSSLCHVHHISATDTVTHMASSWMHSNPPVITGWLLNMDALHTWTHTHTGHSACSCSSCYVAVTACGSKYADDNVFSMVIKTFFHILCWATVDVPASHVRLLFFFFFKSILFIYRQCNSCSICRSLLSKLRGTFTFVFQTALWFLLSQRQLTSPTVPSFLMLV